MKSRLGKADSIFKSTKADKAAAENVQDAAIRPPAGTSVENKLTVILPPGQVDFLDRLALEIRSKTKAKMKRTEIIRALIAALMGSGIDLTNCDSEEAIANFLRGRLSQ